MSELATREDVSRLINRVAFGATEADLDKWSGQPYADLVEHLLDVPTEPALRQPTAGEVLHRADGIDTFINLTGDDPVSHWLEVMRTTPYPLEERFTFFLHDHLATAPEGSAPSIQHVAAQIVRIRTHALGNFRDLIAAITIDPAMLYWLDGDTNTKVKPNENYARELMELFTLGKLPQVYTEEDVREAARMLTGWRPADAIDKLLRADAPFFGGPQTRDDAQFWPDDHDDGDKVVLGRAFRSRGIDEYLDLIDHLLAQPSASRWIAYRMIRALAYTPDVGSVFGEPLIEEVAAALVANDWDLRPAIRALLLSDGFRYTDRANGQQLVRPPADLVVHAAKVLDLTFADDLPFINGSFIGGADDYLEQMGQVPMYPPSVFGWPDSEHWLGTTAVAHRYLLGYAVIGATRPFVGFGTHADLPVSNDLDGWAAKFGLAGFSVNTSAAIKDYLESQAGRSESVLQEGVLMLVLSAPEWEVV
ncbi:MAG: DUF1800 domain-containing protein [Actinobacteria bacterium]|nr:DUF1800 domain-containing protein [Actinomycetota bacterium]